MADRWTNERDRTWRDRERSYQDWRDRDARGSQAYGRGENRSWREAEYEDRPGIGDDDDRSHRGVASGVAVSQAGRGAGQGRSGGPPRFTSQDYTGRQGQERGRGDYGAGRGYGGEQGYRGRPEQSRWDDDAPAFAYQVERYEARTWDLEDDRPRTRDEARRDVDRYDREREDRYARSYRDRDEDRYRAERHGYGRHRDPDRDHDRDHDRGEGAGDFLQRAGERISSWFRGDRDEEGDDRRYYRSDFGREARPLHRGSGPKGYQRSDERIGDEVHQRLTDDPWVDASDIDVEVKSGEVTLTGHVDNREAKHRAERLIEDLSGVRHVQNNLRVNPAASLTSAGHGYGSSALEAQIRRNDKANDPGNNGVSGLSGRTSTGAAAERSTSSQPGAKRP